ncbi:MAG TPA: cyclodeaminase/cyclohydrolase family protein [Bacillota bacterium]|nr:cyclodeaminase/cyclohydrolase family protein [Bacillota bacterium]HOH09774.1 cyclodeaminase/cyclohydrolase family protein [Bacillota bacterium]HPI00661.1 cyclodeaminase/cyclohydrolase family protein [Bacillota bacterium]HPM63830.1 cyclodeaminase/cyclohydrolase family protein [Bacillota bacterium]
MKKLVELSVEDFLEALSSDCPTPGGGSVAALEGAFASSLVEMVARLTIGKEKYKEHEELMRSALEEAYRLRAELTDLIDMDKEAYDNVTSAYKLPKGTPEEKAERSSAIQHALKMATNIPLETMQKASRCLDLIGRIKGKVNVNCASDLEVAELSASASMKGAWQNVMINLEGVKDEDFVEKTRRLCAVR